MDDYNMWHYWRDKKGTLRALEEYFPETLKNSVQLRLAVAQIKNNYAVIESIMERNYEDIDLGP